MNRSVFHSLHSFDSFDPLHGLDSSFLDVDFLFGLGVDNWPICFLDIFPIIPFNNDGFSDLIGLELPGAGWG